MGYRGDFGNKGGRRDFGGNGGRNRGYRDNSDSGFFGSGGTYHYGSRPPGRNFGNNFNGGFQQPRQQRRFDEPVIVTGDPEEVTVKWFNPEKGYGFVIDSGNNELFLHITVVRRCNINSLMPNQKILIQRGPSRRPGQDAVNHIVVNNNILPVDLAATGQSGNSAT
jgi:CspA family cold shock protein